MSNEILLAIVGGLFSIIAALIAAMWGQNSTRIGKLERTANDQDTVDRQQGERLAKLEERSSNHSAALDSTVDRIDNRLSTMESKLDKILLGGRGGGSGTMGSPYPGQYRKPGGGE